MDEEASRGTTSEPEEVSPHFQVEGEGGFVSSADIEDEALQREVRRRERVATAAASREEESPPVLPHEGAGQSAGAEERGAPVDETELEVDHEERGGAGASAKSGSLRGDVSLQLTRGCRVEVAEEAEARIYPGETGILDEPRTMRERDRRDAEAWKW